MIRIRYRKRVNLRNLFSYKRFTFINVIGLSVGLTISLLILLYVRYESSFDNFNPNAGNIYRVVLRNTQDGSVGASTPLPLSEVLRKDFPEIDKVTGLIRTWEEINVGQDRYENLKGGIVEGTFFEMFNIPLVSGNPATIFRNPDEAVITVRLAQLLYGDVNPMGKTFEYEKTIFTITGVIRTIPANSIFDFDYFLADPFRHITYPDFAERWYNTGLFTFVTFHGNREPEGFEIRLAGIQTKYYPDFMKNRHTYFLTGFKGSHLNPALQNDLVPAVAPVYLWIMSLIAIGILLIACLNFMNISIASAGRRNIETGIKKVFGASAGSIYADFFAETTLVVGASLIISFIGVELLLPYFNNLAGKSISIDFSDPVLWFGVIGFGLITTLLSGIYPAIVLSGSSPIRVLRHRRMATQNRLTFQKGFVVLQFVISIVLGIVQLFIYKQIDYMQNHEGGFSKKNLVALSVRSIGENAAERIKNTAILVQTLGQYRSEYGYGEAAVTEFVPGFGFRNRFRIYPEGTDRPDGIELLSCDVDEHFREVYGLQMVQGRYFSTGFSTDTDALILNESAYKLLGWETVVGKSVGLFAKDNKKEVIGVINDINIKSLEYPIEPMIYQFGRHHNFPGYVTLRLAPGRTAETLAFIKKEWTRLFPEVPFVMEGLEEKFRASYGEEEKLARITGIFSILAMLLSLLGIFALSAMESDMRTKEIGIRRVNGARIYEVVGRLNRDFLKWVGIAYVISVPVAWLIVHRWLENFAYRTGLSWWVFVVVGLVVVFLAVGTVTWQSWRAATRNPVESLRYE